MASRRTERLAGRYRVLSRLGEGAFADVFRVRDELLDRELALKRFKAANLTSEGLEILREEFLLLTKLHHRGILQVHDVSVSGRQPFFTMEYLRGPDLFDGLRKGAAGPLPPESMQSAVSVLLRMVSTLRYLHAQGVVHGDLKPSNVLFRSPADGDDPPGDDVVLVDFGLHLPALRGSGITGTLAYMAPEQMSSGALNAATDLFSLGVLFYEILAGERPWQGQDPLLRLQAGGAQVPPLAARVPDLPEGLGDVVHRLLATERLLRYRTAEEVQRDLLLVGGREEADAAAVMRRDFQFDPGLVGRESQLALLRDHAAAAGKSGTGRLMALMAEPGLGGRRLQRALREQVEAAGGLVVTCGTAAGNVQGTVDGIIRRLEGNASEASEEERVLRRELKLVLEDFHPAGDRADDLSTRRQEVFERLSRWAGAALRRRGPEGAETVWVLEDVHRADEVSGACIRHLAGGLAGLPALLLLVGQRGAWLDEVDEESRLILEGLDREQTETVLRANFPDLQEASEVSTVVHERVQGNLLLLELLITEQVRSGALSYGAQGWVADREALRTCRLPASAAQALQGRVDALSADQQQVLCAGALFGVRFEAHWVAATLAHKRAEVLAVLESLARLNLVQRAESPVAAPVYRFAHPSLVELLQQAAEPARLRALRLAAADALRRELAAGQEQAREPLARLCEALRQKAEAARLYKDLGRGAKVRLEPETAFAHLSHALDLCRRARQPVSLELLHAVEDQALVLGRYQEALDVQRKLLRRAADDEGVRACLLVRMGRAHHLLGEARAARRRIQQALQLVPAAKMGKVGIEANRILAQVARREGNYDEAEQLYAEAAELAGGQSKEALIRVLTSQGEFFLKQGDPERGEQAFQRCLDLAKTGKERVLLPGIYVGLGQLWMDRNPAEAVAPFEKAAELAREHAQSLLEMSAYYNLGIVFTDLLLSERARECYLRAQGLIRRKTGVMPARIEAQLGNLARECGDFRQADSHYRAFIDKARDLPEGSPIRLLHRVNCGLLALARGEAQAGLEELRRHESDFAETYPRARMAYQRTRARLELEVGEREEAKRRARNVAELAERHQDKYFRIGAAMLEGELARNGPDPYGAQEKLLEARRLATQMGNRKLEAEVSLLLAEIRLERPELGDDPRAPLERARELLERGGMRPALERVARITRRLAGMPEATHRPSRTLKELSTLYSVSNVIRSHESLDDLFSKLLDTAIELTAAERGFIFLTRKGSRRLDARASRGGDQAVLRDAGQISKNILKATVQDAAPVFSTNAMTDERFRSNQSVLNYGIRSFICVPLLLPERVLGTLYVDHRKLDSLFGQSDADFLMAYANFAAAAIENALLQGDLTKEVHHLRREVRQSWEKEPMVGDSPAMREVRELIERIGPTESNVLVRGESGTGKELVARGLHEHSDRAQGPLVAVNCAALPESLVESELFGVVRGAATDVEERAGKFEEAQGGTLFLDEIGDLSLAAQAKILRAVQGRRIQRVGSNRSVDLDIRLVCATHADLEAALQTGAFREDLYYRLNVVEIGLLPLRERREDVAAILRHFVDRFCLEQGKPTLHMDSDTLATYLDYDWPGNVRELRNAVERAVLLAHDERLPPFVRPSMHERGATDLVDAFQRGHDEKQVKQAYARLVYQRLGGNKRRACRVLGIDYKTLQNRLSPDS